MTDIGINKDQGEMIVVEVAPHDIDFFNKLLEGYDNLALVTTLDAKLGKLAVWVSKYSLKDALAILRCLPVPVRFLSHKS